MEWKQCSKAPQAGVAGRMAICHVPSFKYPKLGWCMRMLMLAIPILTLSGQLALAQPDLVVVDIGTYSATPIESEHNTFCKHSRFVVGEIQPVPNICSFRVSEQIDFVFRNDFKCTTLPDCGQGSLPFFDFRFSSQNNTPLRLLQNPSVAAPNDLSVCTGINSGLRPWRFVN